MDLGEITYMHPFQLRTSKIIKNYMQGFTLIECMTVIGLIALFCLMTGQLAGSLFASYEARNLVHATAQAFLLDAQRIRTLARSKKVTLSLIPRCNNSWESGWMVIENPHFDFIHQTKQEFLWEKGLPNAVTSILPKNNPPVSGNQFSDVSIKSHTYPKCTEISVPDETSQKLKHVSFNAVGAAQTKNGGFIANRLVFWSKRFANIEYHIVLGGAGRIRLCKPEAINPKCSLSF